MLVLLTIAISERHAQSMRFDQEALRHRRRSAGFSLLELLAAVGILMVVAAIAIVKVQSAVQAVRLRGSGTDYANLLQNARIRAVKDDKYYAVLTNAVANPPIAYIDINGSGTYDVGEPVMPFLPDTGPAAFAGAPAVAN